MMKPEGILPYRKVSVILPSRERQDSSTLPEHLHTIKVRIPPNPPKPIRADKIT